VRHARRQTGSVGRCEHRGSGGVAGGVRPQDRRGDVDRGVAAVWVVHEDVERHLEGGPRCRVPELVLLVGIDVGTVRVGVLDEPGPALSARVGLQQDVGRVVRGIGRCAGRGQCRSDDDGHGEQQCSSHGNLAVSVPERIAPTLIRGVTIDHD